MSQAATLNIDDAVATINLNRANKLNSYNLDMARSLLQHTEELSFNQNVKVILLRGDGNSFMAGGDINFFSETLSTMPQGVRSIIRTLADTIKNIRNSKQIYIAAVHGAVAGAGMSLMLACDLVLASTETTFLTAYSKLGTSPDGGLSYFLPKLIGDKKAMQLLLLSERLDSKAFYDLGLINELCDEVQFNERIKSWLIKLSKLPFQASSQIKQLVYSSHQNSLDDQFEQEAKCFIASTQTKEFSEGVTAFLEKRQPDFNK